MEDIFSKTEYSEKDIEQLITNKIEESNSLDYKRGDALRLTDECKDEIAKDVSSFANSNGGLIIYGVQERNHVPNKLHFVDGNKITKEWIEQVIQARIARRIEGLEVVPIRFGKDISKSVYVVRIPASNRSPHMTKTKSYYRRYQFSSVLMEEYEVRNLYLKTSQIELEIHEIRGVKGSNTNMVEQISPITGNIKLWVVLKNLGQVIAKEHKIQIRVVNSILNSRDSEDPNYLNKYVKRKEEHHTIFSIHRKESIFPNEKYNYGYIRLKLDDITDLENLSIEIKVHHENGFIERNIPLSEAFK